MTVPSIRARLIGAGALVLVAFLAVAGVALQRAHADSVRAAHYARLQGTVYLLLAGAELDAQGALVMPPDLAEPRLALPGSGLYASVLHGPSGARWQSASALGLSLPFARSAAVGEWRFEEVQGEPGQGGRAAYLAASYGVRWAGAGGSGVPLVLSVLESRATLDRESLAFSRTLWGWLAGAGVLLLLAQGLLLRWGLQPLRRVAGEIARVESGDQAELQGRYPAELAGLTSNLNTLIRQERVRQTRYKEALSFLAHSLKTPLAVLRNALGQPAGAAQDLPATVAQQVDRMDHIVQHQLGRAMASGAARFVPRLALAPVAQRVRESLAKVYAGKGVQVTVDGPPDLAWRLDEGDAFELLGNLMDNAVKWAAAQVTVRLWQEGPALRLRVDDDGPGFTDTQAVLQLHVRADEKVPGHGVGLAVVNDLVASHGGTLVLGRADLGGARVDVTLPGG